MDNYEDKIPKTIIEKCRMVFNDNAVNIFRKTSDQCEYALLSLMQGENQDEKFTLIQKNNCGEIWNHIWSFLLFT